MKAAPSFSAQKLVLSLSVAVGFTLTRVVTLAVRSTDTGNEDSMYLRSSVKSRFLQEEVEQCTEVCCEKFQVECASANPLAFLPLAVQIICMLVFISLSALFSGLTLGLLGLDKTGLEIVMDGGDEKNAAYARIIYPVRKNGNLLLCTLLLGNTSVNALLSILLADKAGGIIGFIASTFTILIFGEIGPQALCSRYALEIGSKAVPLVRVIMVILYPITKPLSWILDQALGEELTTTYSSSELLKMFEIHVKENALDQDTANTMTGALTFKDTRVRQVMTPIANAFMLSMDEKLNFEIIAAIFKTGYSRIPVYEISQVRRV
jgi:metal transporter CNNM